MPCSTIRSGAAAALLSISLLVCGRGTVHASDQTTLCHFPPGNEQNAHTISIGERAVAAHLDHGDVLGECADPDSCGNGEVDDTEGCDGEDLGGRTCEDVLGPGATGTPACTELCALAPGTCQLCGNAIVEGTEQCDDGNDIPNDACNLCVTDEDHED